MQLDGCPRHELENDVVHYCHPEERVNYALTLDVTNEVGGWVGGLGRAGRVFVCLCVHSRLSAVAIDRVTHSY